MAVVVLAIVFRPHDVDVVVERMAKPLVPLPLLLLRCKPFIRVGCDGITTLTPTVPIAWSWVAISFPTTRGNDTDEKKPPS